MVSNFSRSLILPKDDSELLLSIILFDDTEQQLYDNLLKCVLNVDTQDALDIGKLAEKIPSKYLEIEQLPYQGDLSGIVYSEYHRKLNYMILGALILLTKSPITSNLKERIIESIDWDFEYERRWKGVSKKDFLDYRRKLLGMFKKLVIDYPTV